MIRRLEGPTLGARYLLGRVFDKLGRDLNDISVMFNPNKGKVERLHGILYEGMERYVRNEGGRVILDVRAVKTENGIVDDQVSLDLSLGGDRSLAVNLMKLSVYALNHNDKEVMQKVIKAVDGLSTENEYSL